MVNESYSYKLGGSLAVEALCYVKRQADEDFYQGLRLGEFCYVLNARQMGKSSLQARTRQRLEADGVSCAIVDITAIGTTESTAVEWYAGMIDALVNGFGLYERFDLDEWWEQWPLLSPVQRFSKFLEQVLLELVSGDVVIFVDEIDSVRSLPFDADDFFAVIRSVYNLRSTEPKYRRLTFALIGAATPVDLIRDMQRTPFNVGRAIDLVGFDLAETEPLQVGLGAARGAMPEILDWTGGQPFLTQKVCQLVAAGMPPSPPWKGGDMREIVGGIVRSQIIENWEGKDDPVHLRTIRSRLLAGGEVQAGRLLGLYQAVLAGVDGIGADDSGEQMQLRLSGLVAQRDGRLQVFNRIYRSVFDQAWVAAELAKLRPAYYGAAIADWLRSGDESLLLRGSALRDGLSWAEGKQLSDEDSRFLRSSQEAENQAEKEANQILATATQKAKKRLSLSLIGAISALVMAGIAVPSSIKAGFDRDQAQRETTTAKQDKEKLESEKGLLDKSLKNAQAKEKIAQEQENVAKKNIQQATEQLTAAQQQEKAAKSQALQAARQVEVAQQQYQQARQQAEQATQQLGQVNASKAQAEAAMITAKQAQKQAEQSQKQAEQSKNMAEQQLQVAKEETLRISALKQTAEQELKVAQTNMTEAKMGVSLEQAAASALRQFQDGSGDGKRRALFSALEAANQLELLVQNRPLEQYPTTAPLLALQIMLNHFPSSKTLLRNQSEATKSTFPKVPSQNFKLANITYSYDEQKIIVSGEESFLVLDSQTGKKLGTEVPVPGLISSIASLPENQVLTAGGDGIVRLWSESGKMIGQWQAHDGTITSISANTSKGIVATCGDNIIKIWDILGNQLGEIRVPSNSVISVSVNTNKIEIATMESDGTLRFWESSGNQTSVYRESREPINLFYVDQPKHLIVSPTNERLMTITAPEGIVRVWDLTGRQIGQFNNDQGRIVGADFGVRDGKKLLILRDDGTFQIYPVLNLNELISISCTLLKDEIISDSRYTKICSRSHTNQY